MGPTRSAGFAAISPKTLSFSAKMPFRVNGSNDCVFLADRAAFRLAKLWEDARFQSLGFSASIGGHIVVGWAASLSPGFFRFMNGRRKRGELRHQILPRRLALAELDGARLLTQQP